MNIFIFNNFHMYDRYGPNIHQSIREALRGLDDQCEWLEERKRELSEKAQQNLQQKQELAAAASARKRGKKGKGGEVAAAEEEEKKAEVAVEVVGETTSSTSRGLYTCIYVCMMNNK